MSPAQPGASSSLGLPRRVRRHVAGMLLILGLIPLVLAVSGSVRLLAQNLLQFFPVATPPAQAEQSEPTPRPRASGFSFSGSSLHPDQRFRPYLGQPVHEIRASMSTARMIPAFRNLLDLYVQRQAVDDNFTIRIVDNRTNEVLELFELQAERDRYHATGAVNWGAVDALRRLHTKRLIRKYAENGVPREAITVKWGRADQVREARRRDAPYIEYEVRLARYLGLSLLATEIGTVETFNQDHLVSPVGARSRYQMMPYILRNQGIHHYRLHTALGKPVSVYEEWNPLLTMEPAFLLLRGYVNAVGHEIPGLSAYHTGPNNLFKILRLFLTEESHLFTNNTSVMDAYVWALTDGYDVVSKKTTFRSYSRGYVASAYGSLRAVEDVPIDTMHTFRGERVQLRPGAEIFLSELLRAIDESGALLYWGPGTRQYSLYERFRRMNPHFDLPPAYGEEGIGVPAEGDVRLVHEVEDATVRFFLPLNATRILAARGLDVFDDAATFRFDARTYMPPDPGEKTMWDYQYDALVRDIEYFGFTEENRRRLRMLADRFEELARAHPTHFRRTQLAVIRTHEQLWSYGGWKELATATQAAQGSLRLPARPPTAPDPLPDVVDRPRPRM